MVMDIEWMEDGGVVTRGSWIFGLLCFVFLFCCQYSTGFLFYARVGSDNNTTEV